MVQYERTSPVRHPGLVAAVVLLFAMVIGVLLLHRNVFVLRSVRVEGATGYSNQQVADTAGLRYGQSIFALDQRQMARNLQEECSLLLESIYVDYPNALILHVRERAPRAALSGKGLYTMVDEDNVVLEIAGALDPRLQIPVVTGLEASREDVGMPLGAWVPAQLEAMNEVLTELQLQMVIARVSELNVANLDNLYLVTKEGMIIELGDSDQMELKIGMMRVTLDRLALMGIYTGTLDVAVPYTADYMEGRGLDYQYRTEPTAVPNELVRR